jgi:hypothetical protein
VYIIYSNDYDTSLLPVILVIGGIIGMIIFHAIGYEFEKTSIGEPIVNSAKTIVSIDNNIENAKMKVVNKTISALNKDLNNS